MHSVLRIHGSCTHRSNPQDSKPVRKHSDGIAADAHRVIRPAVAVSLLNTYRLFSCHYSLKNSATIHSFYTVMSI